MATTEERRQIRREALAEAYSEVRALLSDENRAPESEALGRALKAIERVGKRDVGRG